jgi:DNA-binding PadR family transcriptional regulator
MHAMHMKRHCGPRFNAWSMMGGGPRFDAWSMMGGGGPGDDDEGRGEGRGGGRGRHGGHGRGGGPGRGPWGGPPLGFGPGGFGGGPGGFGPGGPGGPGRGGPFGRGRRRRGDVRAALLLLLEEEPRNGYGLMQEIEQRSDGAWRPSPGSVYPALAQLEDEGLVRSKEDDGRKLFELTDAGRTNVEENREKLGQPWEQVAGSVREGALELRDLTWQVGAATMQVLQAGNGAQVARAREVLTEARRSLYRILADDEPADPSTEGDTPAS